MGTRFLGSHSTTCSSAPPVASLLPSGEKAIHSIRFSWAFGNVITLPVAKSYSPTSKAEWPTLRLHTASVRSSGANAAGPRKARFVFKSNSRLASVAIDRSSHTLGVAPGAPETRSLPLRLKARLAHSPLELFVE